MAPTRREELTDAVRRLAGQRNDQEAWERLFALSWPTAVATTHRVLAGQLDLAEDAAQEAFKKIVRYCDFATLSDGDSFLAYLHTVCRHVALDIRRKLSEKGEQQPVGVDITDAQGRAASRDPEQSLRETETRRELQAQLNDEERKLFALMREEYSLAEIASKLGISYSAAGVRVHRLREKLRKRLKEL